MKLTNAVKKWRRRVTVTFNPEQSWSSLILYSIICRLILIIIRWITQQKLLTLGCSQIVQKYSCISLLTGLVNNDTIVRFQGWLFLAKIKSPEIFCTTHFSFFKLIANLFLSSQLKFSCWTLLWCLKPIVNGRYQSTRIKIMQEKYNYLLMYDSKRYDFG